MQRMLFLVFHNYQHVFGVASNIAIYTVIVYFICFLSFFQLNVKY